MSPNNQPAEHFEKNGIQEKKPKLFTELNIHFMHENRHES